MAQGRRYSEEEVRAILERALTRSQSSSSGVSHDDLLAAASEVGIAREDIERAAVEVSEGRDEREARAHILARRKRGFSSHLWAFLGVNVFLLAINLLTTPAILWAAFPLLGWGLGLFFHARAALSKEVSEGAVRREVERRVKARKKQRKLEEEERRRAEKQSSKVGKLERGAAELGSAVQEGVGLLLSRLADEIREETSKERRKRGGVRVAGQDGDRQRIDFDSEDPFAEQAEAEAEEEDEEERRGRRRKR
ncbi:MAG: 2TM domain-containing protein [Myxococcales bacterium]|nr:2TM domain-containing protein [Myxococcales bacterium]